MRLISDWRPRQSPTVGAHARRHPAWQLANELTWRVWSATADCPDEPDAWVLRDRARASARLVASSIERGFERGDRGYFARFMAVARNSVDHVHDELFQLVERGYLSPREFERLSDQIRQTAAAISSLIRNARQARDAQLTSR